MRVLIANVYYHPQSFGGATVVAEQTAARLAARGWEVFVLTTMTTRGRVEYEIARWSADAIPVVGVALAPKPEHTHGYSNPHLIPRFNQIVDLLRPDVIHFHAIQQMGIEIVEESLARGIPTVVTLHDAWWLCERQFMIRPSGQWCGQTAINPAVCDTCVYDRIEHRSRQERSRMILNSCSRVLTPSHYWRQLMVDSGLDAGNVYVNENGVQHPPALWQRSQSSGPLRFGFVGGLGPIKGYPQILQAFQSVGNDQYVLRVVDGMRNLGRTGIRDVDFEIPGTVEIIPAYTQASMDSFFDSIDVLLFPSQWPESYGLTVREAITRGVWPIVPDLGAVAESVSDGVNGTKMPSTSSGEDLARAIEWTLSNVSSVRSPRPGSPIPTFDDQTVDLELHLKSVLSVV